MNTTKISIWSHLNPRPWRRWCLVFLAGFQAAIVSRADVHPLALGDNNDGQCNIPADLTNVTAIAGGTIHSLALMGNGRVVGWGDNLLGETTVPTGLSNVVAISAGYFRSLALKADGTVTAFGSVPPPAGLSNAVAIAAGWGYQSLALRNDGSVFAWGTTSNNPPPLTNAIAIAAGAAHGLALKADGKVVAWGDNSAGQATVPPSLASVVAIAAGEEHNLALKSDGTVVAWGLPESGRTAVPAGLTNVVKIAAGGRHSIALKSDGTLAAWGYNAYEQCSFRPDQSNTVAIAGGGYHSLLLWGDSAPVIIMQPASQTAVITKSATMRVMAVGTQPLRYQWQRNGTNLNSFTNSAVTFTSVKAGDAGTYAVLVSNPFGSVLSSNAVLTAVGAPPIILTSPQDASAICGESTTFRVTADGSTPFSYQWQFEGNPIAGATRSTLVLSNITPAQVGGYAAVVSNPYGSVTSAVAMLTLIVQPPTITSALSAAGKQGMAFTYRITAIHTPISFSAANLPAGLVCDPVTGIISGSPMESGVFPSIIGSANACSTDTKTLMLTITSSVPVITSSLAVTGVEQVPFTYQITATDLPDSFGAQPLPLGLSFDSTTGIFDGMSVYAGGFDLTLSASNRWGIGTTNLHITFSNAPISGLAIDNVTYTYSSPYLLDFAFSLRDDPDPAVGHAVVVSPRLLSVVCKEDDKSISTSETAFIVAPGSTKIFKAHLVLDYTESMASLANGDTNNDGISDAIDNMVMGAKDFILQQPPEAQVGVFEFHREDFDPQKVAGLTTDKVLLEQSIDGIWTNYVQWFPAGSRCWDTVMAAITDLGASNRDEQHYVVFLSDGKDESSYSSVKNLISAAQTNAVKIYCIGFGDELDSTTLTQITSQTGGRYYEATNATDLATQFAQIGKDLRGQYILRWATLKRSTNAFMPSFEITYQGQTAYSPTNPVTTNTNGTPTINTNTTPPTTNYPLVTNIIIAPYIPTEHTGSVTVGSLRLIANAEVHPVSATLRAGYVPRYIRRLRVHYLANYPCVTTLASTAPGEILYGWSMTETNDGAGGKWLELLSPPPQSLTNSLPYGAFGNLVNFAMRDMTNAQTAFSLFEVDNSIYKTTGGQSFTIDTNGFITPYPVLPYGTPVPWLMAHGFTNDFVNAELSDPDSDGTPTWQEYRANTDPRDPNSKFVIRSVGKTGLYGHWQITFSTALSRTYRVDSSPDLMTWQTVSDGIAGIGGDITVTDPQNPYGIAQVYYRILVY